MNNRYVLYDDYLKKYINITASEYREDLMQKPFYKSYQNFKKFRLCKDEDYFRVGLNNYVEDVKDATG